MSIDLSGARVGIYEVWGPIGEGGMSRVWLARHEELAMPVVIKTLRDSTASEEGALRVRNEARLMARIPSHRVVRAVDAGVHADTPYLVQEYVDGLDLAELDRRRRAALGRALPLWFVCWIVREVAEALHSAHQTGVLHRDVKPSNIFGSPQTGLRLGDFGLAVARSLKLQAPSGTLRFIAPEVLPREGAGLTRATRRSDVYSLGATAYDLRYGRPPFVTREEIMGTAPAVFPVARTPEEAYFQHVVARMLDRDPEQRFHSMTTPRRALGGLARNLRPSLPATSPERGVFQIGPVHVLCTIGDIADVAADGIVNSARDSMTMANGVGRALRQKGGSVIEEEATRNGSRALGEVVATTGGALHCKHVLHAVSAWREASCIGRTFQRALLLAEELGLRSLAIPALGTGLAKVSPEACAFAAASALHWHLLLGGARLREVRFVLYDQATYDCFVEALSGVFLGDLEPEDAPVASPLEVGASGSSVGDDDTILWSGSSG